MRTSFSSSAIQFALLLLCALLVTVYWAALPGPFLLDDFTNLPQARPDAWSVSALIDASLSNSSGPLGRPVAAFTFGLNYLITGESTWGFKVVNLAIHAANTCLVFILFRTLAVQVKGFHPATRLAPRHFALAVAFLWALHPLHVSTVMYVVQRMSLLSTFFILAAMNSYVAARVNYPIRSKPFWGLVSATLLLGLLAVYTKENGALLIAYLIVLEWTVLKQRGDWTATGRIICSAFIVAGLVLSLFFVNSILSLFSIFTGGYAFRDFSLKERLLTQPSVIVDYLGQTLFPRIGQMGLYFDDIAVVQELNAEFLLPMMIIISLVVVFFVLLNRAPLVSLGIGLFLTSHLLESTFLPLELKFEHRNYLGSIGIIVAVISALGTIRLITDRRIVMYSLFVSMSLLLASQTYNRSQVWKSDLALNTHEVNRAPDSRRASSALAIALSRAGRTDEAMAEVTKIVSQYPEDTFASLQLFQICALASSNCQTHLDMAFQTLQTGQITMDTVSILGDLAANKRAGLINDLSHPQLALLLSTTASNTSARLPHTIKSRLQQLLSEAYLETRDYRKAVEAIQTSVLLEPENLALLVRAAEITAGVGEIEEAEHVINLLTKVSPDYVAASDRVSAVRQHVKMRREQKQEGQPTGHPVIH